MFYITALEGRRRVLGEEHKKTLDSMKNMGAPLFHMEDYKGALDYLQQTLRMKEKILGKSHPDTLATVMGMANTYKIGSKDLVKAEEMYRHALDGYERALGKQHERTKTCAKNLAVLYFQEAPSKEKLRKVVTDYPHLLILAEYNIGMLIRDFLSS